MLQFKETIKPSFSILLKKYLLFFALPCLILLPVATKEVLKLVSHTPHCSGGLFQMYLRCYSGSFLLFVIPVLIFLAWVAYSNNIVEIIIKNDRLFLPIRTGVHNAGHVVTIIPLQDIISLKTKTALGHTSIESSVLKEYVIPCPQWYIGDWIAVEFSRPKKSISRFLASLGGDVSSFECEHIRIVFPSEKIEEIKAVIDK
jgi:hypothetical protein